MFIWFIRNLRGYLVIQISGIKATRLLNMFINKNYIIWKVINEEDTSNYTFSISIKDFRKIKPLIKKSKCKIHILHKKGLPFFFYKHRKQKCFVIGLLICLSIIYSSTLFIWDINVSGESTYTKQEIIKDVKENFVLPGTMKKNVNCYELEKALRKKYNKVAWISCEIKGTQLNIVITETVQTSQIELPDYPCDIIAIKDAKINKIVTRNGTPLVGEMDEVKKGDVLISGVITLYNDYDEPIEDTLITANGDVYGITTYCYEDSFDMSYYEKEYTGNTKSGLSLSIFGKMVSINKAKITYKNYDIVETDKIFKLGRTYSLPFGYNKKEVMEYKLVRKTYSDALAKEKAKKILETYVNELKSQGVIIKDINVDLRIVNGKCISSGKIECCEIIGMYQKLDLSAKKEYSQDKSDEDN